MKGYDYYENHSKTEGFERRVIADLVHSLKERGLSRSFVFGRKNSYEEEKEEFILIFFLNCSAEQLDSFNRIAKEFGDDTELLVQFSKRDPEDTNRIIAFDQKDFERSPYLLGSWTATHTNHSMPTWDELRDVPQHTISIIYDDPFD